MPTSLHNTATLSELEEVRDKYNILVFQVLCRGCVNIMLEYHNSLLLQSGITVQFQYSTALYRINIVVQW